MTKDYGTVVSGASVLVAIVVASQQLQMTIKHNKTAIRSNNLERTLIIQQVKAMFQRIINLCEKTDIRSKALLETTEREYMALSTQAPPLILENLRAVEGSYVKAYQSELDKLPPHIHQEMYAHCKSHAEKMIFRLEQFEETIAEYLNAN
nr:hypothetical protein [Brucella intermedia]